VDANGDSGARRFAPQLAPDKTTGAWISWTSRGGVYVRYISPKGEFGDEYRVGSGARANICVDSKGFLHVVYSNGNLQYRKLKVTGVGVKKNTMAADFDGDGLDDIAVYDAGTWHIRGTDDGGLKGYRGNYLGYQVGTAADVPVPADYDGDGKADPAVYEPEVKGGSWRIYNTGSSTLEHRTGLGGGVGDIPVPADYDNDGKADLCVWDANGTWHISYSANGFYTGLTLGKPRNGDVPVPGDYDGDGKMDLAVFQPNGTWHISRSRDGYTGVQWGVVGDLPIPQDYDGNGTWDIAVYRPSTHFWHIKDGAGFGFGTDGDLPVPGRFYSRDTTHAAVYRPSANQWILRMNVVPRFGGGPSDVPIPGRWDADDKADIAICRNSNAGWYINGSTRGYDAYNYGVPGDWLVPADYDGDRIEDAAVWRNGTWYIDGSAGDTLSYKLGNVGDIPIPADYDGDGFTDPGIYEPRSGVWHMGGSTKGYAAKVLGGGVGDWPLAFDCTGDGTADQIIYQRNSTWHIASEEGYEGIVWGAEGMIPFGFVQPAWHDDRATKLALYDPSSRTFYVYPGGDGHMVTLPGGPADMMPVCADYDGDGETDYAAFSQTTGEWLIRRSSDGSFVLGPDTVIVQWGSAASVPIGVRQ